MSIEIVPLPGEPRRRKRVIRLASTRDVRIFLGRITSEVYRNEMPDTKGSRLAAMCMVLLRAFEIADIESRLLALEEKADA